MANDTAVIAGCALGGAALGGVVGSVVSTFSGEVDTHAATGSFLGFVAGLTVGIVATAVGHGSGVRRTALREGDLIGGWRLVGTISAQGSTGPVFLVRRGVQSGVLKSVHRDDARLGTRARLLVREAVAARGVTSSHVAPLLDAGEVAGRPYVVYAFVGDTDLDETVFQRRTRRAIGTPGADEESLWRLATSSARGLQDIHRAGFAHQDLTPTNIMDRGDRAIILDLGMARTAREPMGSSSRKRFALEYAPPERLRDPYAADPAADVYQWAACMVAAATGRAPYGDLRELALTAAIGAGPPPTTGVPVWLRSIVDRCLSPVPARRPTAAQVADELARVGPTRGWALAREAAPPRPAAGRRRVPLEYRVLAGAALVTLVGIVLLPQVLGDPGSTDTDTDGAGPGATTEPGGAVDDATTDSSAPTTPDPTTTTDPPPTTDPTTTAAPPPSTTTTTTTTAPPATTPQDLPWPTSDDDAPQSLYALWGAEATSGEDIPDWSSCYDDYCIAGRGEDIAVYEVGSRGTSRELTFTPGGDRSPYDELLALGFTEDQAAGLLAPS